MNAKLCATCCRGRLRRRGGGCRAEAGQALARGTPGLILMDIQLPGMDGITAVAELKRDARTAKIPVVAVTASAMPLERESILRAGFDGYQAKPISVKDLLAEVRRLMPEV